MLFAWQRRVAGASSQAVRKHSENEKNIDIKNLSSLKHIYNDSFLQKIDANYICFRILDDLVNIYLCNCSCREMLIVWEKMTSLC